MGALPLAILLSLRWTPATASVDLAASVAATNGTVSVDAHSAGDLAASAAPPAGLPQAATSAEASPPAALPPLVPAPLMMPLPTLPVGWPLQAAPENGTITGFVYEPHTLEGTLRTLEATWQLCQSRCQVTPACEHWGFWPDHGCHVQGKDAVLAEAECQEEPRASCAGLAVISGPRTFEKPANFPAAAAVAHAAARAAPHSLVQDVEFQDPGSGGYRGLFLLVALLVAAIAALYFSIMDEWAKRRRLRARQRRLARSQRSPGAADDQDGSESDEESDEEVLPLSRKKKQPS